MIHQFEKEKNSVDFINYSFYFMKVLYKKTLGLLIKKIYSVIDFSVPFKILLINDNSPVPYKPYYGCAGYDVFSNENKILKPGTRCLVDTGICCEIPNNFYIRIAPRSGLSVNYGIDIGAGVVDSSYRGQIKVLVINNGSEPFEISIGDKIAQLIIERCVDADIEVGTILSTSDRGSRGFGSSGYS